MSNAERAIGALLVLMASCAEPKNSGPGAVIQPELFTQAASIALQGAEVRAADAPAAPSPPGVADEIRPLAIKGLTALLGPSANLGEDSGGLQAQRRDYLVDAAQLADGAAVRTFFSGLLGSVAFYIHQQLHPLKGPDDADNEVRVYKSSQPYGGSSARLRAQYTVPGQAGGYEFLLVQQAEGDQRRICCYHYWVDR